MRKFSLMSLCNASTAWYSMVHVKTFWQWIRRLRWWMITEIKNVNTRDFNNQTKRGFSGNRIRLFFKWGFLFTLYVGNNLTSVNCSKSADGKLLVTLPTRPPTPNPHATNILNIPLPQAPLVSQYGGGGLALILITNVIIFHFFRFELKSLLPIASEIQWQRDKGKSAYGRKTKASNLQRACLLRYTQFYKSVHFFGWSLTVISYPDLTLFWPWEIWLRDYLDRSYFFLEQFSLVSFQTLFLVSLKINS